MKTYIPSLDEYMAEKATVTKGRSAQKMGTWRKYDINKLQVGDFVKVDKDKAIKNMDTTDKKIFMGHWERSGAKRDQMMYVAGVKSKSILVAGSKTSAMIGAVEIPMDAVIVKEDINEARVPKDEQIEIVRDYLLDMGLDEITSQEAEQLVNLYADNEPDDIDKYSVSAVYLKNDKDTDQQISRQLTGLSLVKPKAKYFHVSKSPLGYGSKSKQMKRTGKKNVFVHGFSEK